ncbi:MAG: transglycosylase SLT domain-containing protein [Alistipes sp.]
MTQTSKILLLLSAAFLLTTITPTDAHARHKTPPPTARKGVTQKATPITKVAAPTARPAVYAPSRHEITPSQYDSLLTAWRESRTMESYDRFFEDYIYIDPSTNSNDPTSDSVYTERLRALASPIQLPFNHIVKSYITRYTDSRYGLMSRILGMSQYYFPMIEEELIKSGLPVELRALPIIESALSATAISPVGAAGLWQFMPTTGKGYGLEVNSLVDQRFDPLLATRAACRYLKDLYRIFHDWPLAIAAYNCGPGNVNKALARTGGKGSFWDIYEWLPRETRGYIPAFIGASYAYAYHKMHHLEFAKSPLPLATDTIRVDRLMHFGQISSTIEVPIEMLRLLNPQYKADIIPATIKPYTLTLPQYAVSQYIADESEIFGKDTLYLNDYLNPNNIDKKRIASTTPAPAALGFVYTIRRGDTLASIARRYNVTQTQLMRWNRIKNSHLIRIGQKIRIEGRRK